MRNKFQTVEEKTMDLEDMMDDSISPVDLNDDNLDSFLARSKETQ